MISSAYINFLEFVGRKSFVYRLNNNWVSTEPCGSPLFNNLILLFTSSMSTIISLLLSTLLSNVYNVLHGNTSRNFVSSPFRHTVSYPDYKSIKTTPVFYLLLYPFSMWIVSAITWLQQFLYGRKPACSCGIILSISSEMRL